MSTIKRRSLSSSPDTGALETVVLVGDSAELLAAKAVYEARGYKVALNNTGDGLELEYVTPGDDFKDVWNIRAERDQIPLERSPAIFALLSSPLGDFATAEEAFDYSLAKVQSAVTWHSGKGTVYGYASPLNNNEYSVYVHYRLGVTTCPAKRVALRRVRTIPLASSSRMAVSGKEEFWSTAALLTAFAVPAAVAATITGIETSLATPPSGFNWGWHLRDEESEVILNTGRTTETKNWVFGLHSSVLFTFHS